MNIKALRKKRGITQEELSERVGVHENTIRFWEKGTREPRSSDIAKLCEVLGCTESELLNGPASQTWELRLVVSQTGKETKKDTLDMSGATSSAVMNLSDDVMAITLSAGYEVWKDDSLFEALIENLRRKRRNWLKMCCESW